MLNIIEGIAKIGGGPVQPEIVNSRLILFLIDERRTDNKTGGVTGR